VLRISLRGFVVIYRVSLVFLRDLALWCFRYLGVVFFFSLCMFSLSGLVFVLFFCMVYSLCLISLSLVVCFSLLFPWVVFLWSCLYSSPYVYIVLSLFVLFSCFFVSMFCLFVLFSLCLFMSSLFSFTEVSLVYLRCTLLCRYCLTFVGIVFSSFCVF
jgi:hypothetical protein